MRTLYGGNGRGGALSPTSRHDEFLFFADPAQDFVIADVVPDNRYEREGANWIGDIRLNQLYAMWDGLMAAHPDYISKTNLGKDQSGAYDIFRYTVSSPTPKDSNNTPIPGRKIKLMLETVHSEFNNRVYMFEFIRLLFTQDHLPVIKALKENVEFSCMPAANPYGLENGIRQNSRGVDINKNQEQGWRPNGVIGDFQYSGPSPLSEAETVILAAEMDRFKPDIHLACHSHGNQEANGSFFHTVPNPGEGINNTSYKGHMRACMNAKQMYPALQAPEVLMSLRTNLNPEGSARSTDAAWSKGAISLSLECSGSIDLPGIKDVSGTKEAITLDVMAVLFCALECIKRVMYY